MNAATVSLTWVSAAPRGFPSVRHSTDQATAAPAPSLWVPPPMAPFPGWAQGQAQTAVAHLSPARGPEKPQDGFGFKAQTWTFPPGSTIEVVCSLCRTSMPQIGKSPKPGVSLRHFLKANVVPGTTPAAAGAAFWQKVHGHVGRGSMKRPLRHSRGSDRTEAPRASSVFPQGMGHVEYTSGLGH